MQLCADIPTLLGWRVSGNVTKAFSPAKDWSPYWFKLRCSGCLYSTSKSKNIGRNGRDSRLSHYFAPRWSHYLAASVLCSQYQELLLAQAQCQGRVGCMHSCQTASGLGEAGERSADECRTLVTTQQQAAASTANANTAVMAAVQRDQAVKSLGIVIYSQVI